MSESVGLGTHLNSGATALSRLRERFGKAIVWPKPDDPMFSGDFVIEPVRPREKKVAEQGDPQAPDETNEQDVEE